VLPSLRNKTMRQMQLTQSLTIALLQRMHLSSQPRPLLETLLIMNITLLMNKTLLIMNISVRSFFNRCKTNHSPLKRK
jgi:hypothetical protein